MRNWGLLGRALLMGTLPTLMISMVLGVFFTNSQFQTIDETAKHRGHTLVSAYAITLGSVLREPDSPKLQGIVQTLIEDSAIRAVVIYDKEGDILSGAGPRLSPTIKVGPQAAINSQPQAHRSPPAYTFNQETITRKTANSLRVIATIHDPFFAPAAMKLPLTLGWIEIEIDPSSTLIAKYKTTLIVLSIILLAFAISYFLTVRFAREITTPVSDLKKVIEDMISGDLSSRSKENAYGELQALQVALNRLSQATLEDQNVLHQDIERATEDLRETLETIEIQNIELDLARKEALEASRIKSQFLANMSHEIRTPLNGIIGFTNLLLKSRLIPSQRDYLETIHKSSESLLAIINDILDFSKIEAGKLVLDQVPLNLLSVVEDVLTMLSPMAHDKRLEQASLFYNDVPQYIIGDPLRLKQIITNLVNNAIKFTQRGDIAVRVMLDDIKDDVATIKVSVTDTGIGISEQEIKNLFNAFGQADTTTARRYGGTGLGLAISKYLVEHMKGKIGINSQQGQGSTFWFTFKAKVQEIHEDHSIKPKDKTLIIYDNNEIVRYSLINTLRKDNYNTIEYTQLSDIESLLLGCNKTDLPDAILIGISPLLPQYHEITQLFAYNKTQTPIIIMGHHTDQSALSNLLDGHPPPLITKPITQTKTLRIVDQVLKAPAWKQLAKESKQTFSTVNETTREHKTQHNRLTIIAVDDNLANLKLISVLLEDLGVNVIACDSGQKCIDTLKQTACDLILMDIQMPEMDGITATRIIRSTEDEDEHIPIIAVTAHALSSEKKHLLNSGMDSYITKPISEEQLLHTINHWTGQDLSTSPPTILPKTSASEQAVDMSLGISRVNGKADLAEEMLEMLFKSLIKDRQAIAKSNKDKRYTHLLEQVHKLHGATGYTGVPQLQASAKKLEHQLKIMEYDNIDSLCQALIAEIDKVLAWGVAHRNLAVETNA